MKNSMTRSVWDFRSFSPDAAGRFRLGRSFGSVVLGGLGLWLLFGLATAEGRGGGGPTPSPFITHLRFAQSFFYDPRAGNLLLDMRSYGAHYVEMQGIQGLDYVGLPGDGVSSLQSRDVFSPIGTKFTGGYII